MTRIEEIDLQIENMNTQLRKENKEDIDSCLAMIKDICLTYDLRVGQLFENMRNMRQEKDLFHFSNKRLELSLEKEFKI